MTVAGYRLKVARFRLQVHLLHPPVLVCRKPVLDAPVSQAFLPDWWLA
jgi:hypothetical protein